MTAKMSLQNGAFSYGEHTVFQKTSLDILPKEILCILGANGCGKTTLLRCLNGSLKLKEGRVSLDNQDIAAMGVSAVARRIGFVFQEHSAPFPYSVLEVVRMGRAPHLGFFATPSSRDTRIAEAALEMVGMAHLRGKPYTQISGGERQLVLIARTLTQEPEVILMDEPTSHLDFKNQTLVLRMIDKLAEQGMSIVMSTHYPNHALLFTSQVALMNHGRFMAVGTSAEVMTEANLCATYGIDIRIITADDPAGGKKIRFCIPSMSSAEGDFEAIKHD